MPNRILRDWTDSKTMNSLGWQEEVLFLRLIMKADDFGCYYADSVLLKSLLFPRKDGLRTADIDRWLDSLKAAGLIRSYQVDGEPFLTIVKFGQRLRQQRRQFPGPPDNFGENEMSAGCQQVVSDLSASGGLKRNEVETESETETEVAHVRAREAKKITKTKVEVAIELPFDSENFKAVWDKWKDYRLKEKRQKFKSQASELAQLKHLYDLAGGVEESAIEIIHQSIGNQWQGLFPLKNKSQNGHKSSNAGGNRIEAIWRT